MILTDTHTHLYSKEFDTDRSQLIKTAIKKVVIAIEDGSSYEATQELLQDAAAKLSRAKSKGVIHANTASRKLSRLALRINKSLEK